MLFRSVQSNRHAKPFSSPPLNPPMAYPATRSFLLIISSMHWSRSSGSSPPWTIAKRFCTSALPDFWCVSIHLSNHRMVRCVASATLGPTVRLETITHGTLLRNPSRNELNRLTYIVELHDDVSANSMLYRDTFFGLHG